MFKLAIKSAALTAFLFLMPSCEDGVQRRVTFVGDSMIERWDVQYCFPNFDCTNMGVSGAGIKYIESLAGRFHGETIAVMIGTNNNGEYPNETLAEKFAQKYCSAIESLGADKVYLFSILPRQAKHDREDINEDIATVNGKIRQMLGDKPNVVYIDTNDEFLDGNRINRQYYVDGLHLTAWGYELLTAKLKQYLD